MFSSRSLLSSKGPLGTIWVAAYFLKRLKKSQITETDIPISVDKILQDEINTVTYRVLGYLLLGVVRIYSKKVEYLFDDINEMLSAIKIFMVNTNNNARMEKLRMHITIPDKFELDAFDLDILEDVAIGNIAPREEITLKDVFWISEGIAQFSLDKYNLGESSLLKGPIVEAFTSYQPKDFETCPNTCTTDNPVAEYVNRFHLMDDDFNFSAPNSAINSQAGKEKSHNIVFPQEEPMNLDTHFIVEGEPTEPVNDLFSQEQHINEEEMTVQEEVDEMYISIEEICRFYQEESVEISMLQGREREPVVLDEPFNESNLINAEQIKATEMVMSENKMHEEIGAVHKASNSQVSNEGLQDTYQEQFMDHDEFSDAELDEHIDGSVEEHQNKGKLDFLGKVSVEEGNLQVILPVSINLEGTPEFKFPDASDARPKAGATTSDLTLIPTPAATETACFSRKTKCILDKKVVFTNRALKRMLSNTSDLICKRRKCPYNLSAARRASRMSSLPGCFYESLLPSHSLELRSLFSKKKMKLGKSVARTVGRPEPMATAPETPPQSSTIRSFESPESPQIINSDNIRPSSSQERREKDQSLDKDGKLNLTKECNLRTSSSDEEHSLEKDEELTLMNECNVRTSSSYEEHSLEKDEEFTLMDEDIDSCETENQETFGWSGRTRQVGSLLHRSFQNMKGKEEFNLSQVLGGRTRKDSARLFYETLVLKSTSCVDVKQIDAYGDILVSKLPKLDETFGTRGDHENP